MRSSLKTCEVFAKMWVLPKDLFVGTSGKTYFKKLPPEVYLQLCKVVLVLFQIVSGVRLVKHPEYGEQLCLVGDHYQRYQICGWLIKKSLVKPDQLELHGLYM